MLPSDLVHEAMVFKDSPTFMVFLQRFSRDPIQVTPLTPVLASGDENDLIRWGNEIPNWSELAPLYFAIQPAYGVVRGWAPVKDNKATYIQRTLQTYGQNNGCLGCELESLVTPPMNKSEFMITGEVPLSISAEFVPDRGRKVAYVAVVPGHFDMPPLLRYEWSEPWLSMLRSYSLHGMRFQSTSIPENMLYLAYSIVKEEQDA